ncbi:MAG: DMT family transporter [Crocinitomicaceae bacterium]|nr:DMT family transporter [Crocinitomicaceae bacterium]
MYKGVLYMLLSSLCFAVINIFVKTLTNSYDFLSDIQEIQNYPAFELVFFRSVVSLSICMAIIRRKKIPFFGNNKKWLLIRGISGATALTCFFITLKHLPLAIATTVQYLSPIFTILFAIKLQKESVKPIQWIFFAVSFSGVAFLGLAGEKSLHIDPKWLLLGLFSAVISGIAYNAIMKCRNTDQPVTIVMYFPLVATPVMLVLSLVTGFVVPVGIEWLLLIGIGALTQVAQITMTRAFHADVAARVTPIKYVGAIYAVAAGFFIFDETLGLYSSLGIILVLLGVLLNTFLKQMKWFTPKS